VQQRERGSDLSGSSMLTRHDRDLSRCGFPKRTRWNLDGGSVDLGRYVGRMTDQAVHYRDLLAHHYSWMLGGDVEQLATQDHRYRDGLGIDASGASGTSVAVDLGCGPGPQTLALADMGFGTVVGVDTSHELLAELVQHASSRPAVQARHADLVDALPDIAG